MLTVKLNTPAIIGQLGTLANIVLDAALDVLGEYAKSTLNTLIRNKVSISQQQRYLKALNARREKNKYIISIDDESIERLESGFDAFDIKPGLLRSSKIKAGKEGPYIDVPFLHRTTKRPAAGVRSTLIPMKALRKVVKKAVSEVAKSGVTQRLFQRTPGIRPSKVSDMVVAREVVGGKETVTARTFRRVSEKSQSDSWIHPGLPGLKLFDSVIATIEKDKNSIIMDVARRVLA